MNFKEQYEHLYDQISPDAELLDHVLTAAQNGGENCRLDKFGKRSQAHSAIRKPVILVVVLFICVFVSMPALAANVPSVYQLMYLVSPTVAQFFMPIQESSVDNGIEMTVVSSYIHDDTAEIYITMQDLTGDRIDDTIDLYDSYSIQRPFDSIATCQLVGYEEKTKTATFLISITEWNNHKIVGDKITFSVKRFLSHEKTYENVEIPLDLSSVRLTPETQKVFTLGGSGDLAMYEDQDGRTISLVPQAPMEGFPVEGIDFTGIGYLDQRLHIQIAVKDPLSNDNHGYFYFGDSNGNEVNQVPCFYFSNGLDGSERIHYVEYIFDVSPEELARYKLYGDFWISGMLTEGDWQVTFPLITQ